VKRAKDNLHPRNRFRHGYDFPALASASPALGPFVKTNPHGNLSIDFANPDAVKALNQALLKHAYGLRAWDLPQGSLCPPIPGRSDYLHYLADLVLEGGAESAPRGAAVSVLDVGVGANCIYPLLGASEYGWRFVGTESDAAAARWAQKLADSNAAVKDLIEIRRQPSAMECFKDVILEGEFFEASMCNPPFHRSAAEAAEGSEKKRRNLSGAKAAGDARNFGGRAAELWCPGGELGFIRRMIAQSVGIRGQCRWFTTLVSKSEHLKTLERAARDAGAARVKVIDMAQGQKRSRILAWTFTPRAAVRA
jgi:23S rRNA (adenine1618-N6)-methyltransferase